MPIKLTNTDAAILCGGLGTRLRPVIGDGQKVMAKIAGRPFLEILIDELTAQGITRIVLLSGYQADDLEKYFSKKKSGPELIFSKEDVPLGTGGALKQAKPLIHSNPFFLLNGDSFCHIDLKKILNFHDSHQALCTMILSSIENQDDYGTVLINGEKRVTAFKEKAGSLGPGHESRINAGVYCFDREIFNRLPAVKKFSLETDVFPQLLKDRVYGFETNNEFTDIGTPQRFQTAQTTLKKGPRSADHERPAKK